MLVVRLHKHPNRKRLEGQIEKATDLPAGTCFTLAKITEHEYHLIALKPLPRLSAKARKATAALFEDCMLEPSEGANGQA